jgi:hypothetical protein
VDTASPAADSGTEVGEVVPLPSRSRRSTAEPISEPLVKKALEEFAAQIVHRDEDFGTTTVKPRPMTDPDTEE